MAPAAAGEGAVGPPSNSAAAQYTEVFPTAGGDKKTDQAAHHRSPSKVLGAKKAHALDKQGSAGKAAAAVAAATAPAPPTSSSAALAESAPTAASGGAQRGDASGKRSAPPANRAPAGENAGPADATAQPQGSSGIESAIGRATGFDSTGSWGWLLPLVLLATLLWAGDYVWRQRRQPE